MPCKSKPGTPTGQQAACGERPPSPARTISLCLRNCSWAQGCRMRLFGSPTAIVGCRPVLRNSSLVTWGWLGSSAMGPGPDGGGDHSAITEIQPTLGLGAKPVGIEDEAGKLVAPEQSTLAKTTTAQSLTDFAIAISFSRGPELTPSAPAPESRAPSARTLPFPAETVNAHCGRPVREPPRLMEVARFGGVSSPAWEGRV